MPEGFIEINSNLIPKKSLFFQEITLYENKHIEQCLRHLDCDVRSLIDQYENPLRHDNKDLRISRCLRQISDSSGLPYNQRP